MANILDEIGDRSLSTTTPSFSIPFPPPNTPPAQTTSASPERVFWISPPLIDSDEKAKYKSIHLDTSLIHSPDDEDETPVEVVGEIRLGTDHYYWVVHGSDVIHKHLAKKFQHAYPELVDAYYKRKEAGSIDTFDEKSSRIHPMDRVNLKVTIPSDYNRAKRRITRTSLSRAAKHSALVVIDSSDDEADDSQGDYDGQSDGDVEEGNIKAKRKKVAEPTRRSTRNTAVDHKISYRNASLTRANPKRHASRIDGGDVLEDEDEDEDYTDQEVSEEDVKPKPKLKKFSRGRLSRPAYGNIRPVADLSDDDTDDEMAALRAHRNTCERCQRPPAHELLNKLYALEKKTRPRKTSKEDDDFEDDVNEEQRYLRLGGWVRCLKCCVAAHWGCLGRSQHDEIIKAARQRDKEAEAVGLKPRKRETLEAYETTEFICGACMKDGICMYCHQMAVIAEPLPQKRGEAEQTHGERHSPNIPDVSAKGTPGENKQDRTTPPTIVVDPSPCTDGGTVVSGIIPPVDLKEQKLSGNPPPPSGEASDLLFRCKACKRLAHYPHLPQPEAGADLSPAELARYYQTENHWECTDCISYVHSLDKILAWRPYPADAVESNRQPGYIPDHKARLPREYLVKWIGKSYRRLQWVPHMWLASTYSTKLKNFLVSGPKVQLLDTQKETEGGKVQTSQAMPEPAKDSDPSFLIAMDNSRDPSAQPVSEEEQGPPPALPDAESRIPLAWRTIDRVLDVRLWDPARRQRTQQEKKAKAPQRRRTARRKRLESDDDDTDTNKEDDLTAETELIAARELGQEPSAEFLETIDQWEQRTGETFGNEEAELVLWAFIKWADLAYEEATWDSTPVPSDAGYNVFQFALRRFVESRTVFVARKSKKEAFQFDDRKKRLFEQKQLSLKSDPELGQVGKLMDFQLTGVNWLFRNWWRHQPSILADEMGLGKTVQVACLVGHLVETYEAYPVLIVVPNSTITNWLREFDIWAPRLRVVPFNGEAKSRDIIRKYELYHESVAKNFTNLKFHVLVTTYETLIGKDFTPIFKMVPRWELLIIDEGQRLKNDSSMLFRRLNELNTIHRILMTGTPLNNNIRELFNLMNFLDPDEWNHLDALEKKYENLSEELLQELHEALKPYFLRRTKADVLTLPPKNEVIVPVSMTAIQKEVYKSILSQNLEILGSLAQPSSRVNTAVKKSNLNNLLMELRKCLQHPYLVSRELEPTGSDLTPQAVHKNLLDASAKLRLLHIMLPKLRAKGHRVLLFSQFVIALDIIEDFLVGEGHKFLRLDGNTKQAQRQKDMDAFNSPDSDIFIFILSTRAGGVGINLWSADTVIIFDPDFNPHQDLQAISRSHRYGQTKTVLVFKLMVKGAAEERIVQTGKKKLALDHLIVQKMDDDGAADDVQSILIFGAKAIFEGTETDDINYSEGDVENLIARTEKEGDQVTEAANSSFGFAKLWVVEKDSLEEVVEDIPADAQDEGFWGNVLARAAVEKAKGKAAEVTGRGAKRRAAVAQKYYYDDGSPAKPKAKRRKSLRESDVEYNASEISDEGQSGPSTTDTPFLSDDEVVSQDRKKRTSDPSHTVTSFNSVINAPEKPQPTYKPALTAIENQRGNTSDESDDERPCGLCGSSHGTGSCFMTQNPSNLAHYRLMLLTESRESIETRRLAVQAIDSYLASRGLSYLSKGQPLRFIDEDGSTALSHKTHSSKNEGTLKRPASPSRSSTPNKKAKRVDLRASPCVICGGPLHLARVCPVVKLGPESIKLAITRLSSEPRFANTVNILHSFLPHTAESQLSGSTASGKQN